MVDRMYQNLKVDNCAAMRDFSYIPQFFLYKKISDTKQLAVFLII